MLKRSDFPAVFEQLDRNQSAAAKGYGVSRKTIQRWLAKAGANPSPLAEMRNQRQRTDELTRLRSTVEEQEREIETMRKSHELLDYLKANTPRHRDIPLFAPTDSQAIPVLCLSDLHCEEVVKLGDVPGSPNEYNPEIFRRRFKSVVQRSLYVTQTLRNMAKIDTFCCWLGGDLISGHIHPELAESNAMSPSQAILMMQEEFGGALEYWLKNGDFKKIIIPTSFGNHGRSTEKMRVQTASEHSFEWLLYRTLAREWAKEKRVDFRISDSYHNIVKMFDTTIRFHHGDNVQYQGGVGGLTIPLNKAIAQWNTITKVDLDVLGHWHQLTDGGRFIVNGSLVGYGAYSAKVKATYEIPQQAYFLVDRKRGKTLTAKIFAE